MADITPPTIAITTNKSALKYGETALITFRISEVATDFVLSDITVSGGTLSNFSGSGTTYSATFTPLENSTVAGLVSVGNYKFSDASGNANEDGNEADNRLALSIDTGIPTITISSSKSIFGVGETALISFKLSEPSIDFTLSDVIVSGGALTNFTGSGVNYSATFTPKAGVSTSGSITVGTNTFSDIAGNFNTRSSVYGIYLNTNSDPQVPKLTWVRRLGSDQTDSAEALTIGIDGSIYVSGFTNGSLDGITKIDSFDSFIAKYSPDGTKIWTQLLGFKGFDSAYALTTGNDGSIYVGGITTGSQDGQINNGTSDGFLTKLSPDGTKLWTRLQGTPGVEKISSISSSLDGYILVAGETTGALDGQTNNGGTDVFITKYNPEGTKVWTRLLGSSGSDNVLNLTSSPDGAFYVAGQTDGSFDGQVSNGAMDGFITKYNQDGNKVWTRLIGSNNYDTANALTIGLDGAIYVGGYTTGGSLDGIQNPTNSAGFVSKFLPDGTRVWTKLNSLSQIYELNTGQDGAIFAAGDVWNQYVDGQLNLGNTDIIVLRYETDGKNTWTKLFGSTLNDTPYALSVGIDGSLYLAGITLSDIYGEKSFDIPFYSDGQAYSKNDAFLMKLSVPDNVPPKISISLAGASITGPLKSGESVVLNFAITEAVKDFIATDITVQGGTLSNFQGSDKSYSATFILGFDITTQSVSVGNGKFSDSSGNFNLDGVDANNKVSFNVSVPADTIAPTVAVTANATSLSASKTATITFTLSESSSNFVVGDISVSGGTLSNFAGSGTTYSATFTPAPNSTANGVVSVASGVFTDSGGNANADGADTNNAISLVVDTALPTIALSTSKSSLIAGESTTLIFVLSEPSTTFSVSDVTVAGGKLSNFTGSGLAYAATFIPSDNSTANGVISVSSGVFTDASNNANADGSEANNTLTLAVDTATPTIALSTVKTNLIEGDAATVTFTLSEASSTFTASDITMTGGTLSNFSGSGTTYTATFTPTANSSVNGVVSVASGVFTDTAGNINADGADKNNALNFTRVPTVANETHILSVIVDKDVLGTSAALLKDLKESITFTNGVITKHTVEYSSLTFDYAQIDALITTVTRDGEFTAEFTKEINDYVASVLNITYAAAVKLVGATSIDAVILSVAGADGNYVG